VSLANSLAEGFLWYDELGDFRHDYSDLSKGNIRERLQYLFLFQSWFMKLLMK
jgi:hypothetical protein